MYVLGNCDFEKEGLCDWQQIQNGEDDFDWSINSGETSSKGTGPKVDHTTGTREGTALTRFKQCQPYATSVLWASSQTRSTIFF